MSKVRDLEADLAICEAATPGPWYDITDRICSEVTTNPNGGPQHWIFQLWFKDEENMQNYAANARFITEAREGWPYAIRRALGAEAEVKRLREERDFWARNEYSLGEKVTRLARELEQRENEIDRLRNELNILQEQLEQRCART